MLKPADLTKEQLEKAVMDLVRFYDFSWFEERGVDTGTGLVYAVEMQVCSLGLVNDEEYEEDYDSAQMMEEYVTLLDKTASEMNIPQWQYIKADMPYARSLSS